MKLLSIIVPAYNEEKTVGELVKRLKSTKLPKIKREIIFVDDGSKDKTPQILKTNDIILIRHRKNRGKGAAVATGLKKSTGEILLIQDADLEYNPKDIPRIIKPIVDGKSEIVYGSRNLGKRTSYSSLLYYAGGLFVEAVTNLILGTKITDSITGYKAFTRRVYEKISPLKSMGFEIEAEITAKSVKNGFKISEVPISYRARTRKEGKKIRWHHAFVILKTIWKYSR